MAHKTYNCTPFNSMAEAFKASPSIQKLGHQAKRQLHRRNLKPRSTVKWHRLAVVAQVVQN